MARKPKVAIIGAGIGGLTAALALHQRGFEVTVHERASSLGEVGAGLQLGPNAVKVIRALGLEERLRPLGYAPLNFVSLAWDSAALRFREPMRAQMEAQFGAPYVMAHRADLHRLLQEALPEGVVTLSARCTGAETRGSTGVAHLADGSAVEADIVVGADGVRSAVRAALWGEAPARYTQQMAWRGIVPIECVPTLVGPGVAIGRDEYVGWIGPEGHVICYPIRGGELYNIFAGHVNEDWVEESWAAPSSRAELLDGYAGWNEALLGMLGNITEVFKWGIHDRDPLDAWTKGRVTLLGDAAHPMMPTLAQGAAISMEDGAALARLLDGQADVASALAAYDAERVLRASRVQLQARQQFLNNRKNPAPPPLSRDWIFAHDAASGTTREAVAA